MRGSRGLRHLPMRTGIVFKSRHYSSHASGDEAIKKVPIVVDYIPNESPAPKLAHCRSAAQSCRRCDYHFAGNLNSGSILNSFLGPGRQRYLLVAERQ